MGLNTKGMNFDILVRADQAYPGDYVGLNIKGMNVHILRCAGVWRLMDKFKLVSQFVSPCTDHGEHRGGDQLDQLCWQRHR